MCCRFEPISREELEEAIEQIRAENEQRGGCVALARILDAQAARAVGKACATPEARIGSTEPVLVVDDGHLDLVDKRWGYDAPWQPNRLLYNARVEDALAKPHGMWADSLAARRCLVPSRGFFESHRGATYVNPRTGRVNKLQVRFGLPLPSASGCTAESGPAAHGEPASANVLIPSSGLETGRALMFLAGIWRDDRFCIMTTAPNESVAPVHDRMPIALAPAEASSWLGRGYARLVDRSALSLVPSPDLPEGVDGTDILQELPFGSGHAHA